MIFWFARYVEFMFTSDGGSTGSGTVFKITTTGTLTTVYNLDPKNGDGAFPVGLVQHSNGIFYGPTVRGVARSLVFLSVWPREPAFGNVGAAVNILGTNLTGATRV